MKIHSFIRALAGFMILLSLTLAYFVSPWWQLLALFVSLNLIQSAFTGFCPPSLVLGKLGWLTADGTIRIGGDKNR